MYAVFIAIPEGGSGLTEFVFHCITFDFDAAMAEVERHHKLHKNDWPLAVIADGDKLPDNYYIDDNCYVLICDRRRCPSHEFVGYCIEEVSPLDDNAAGLK